MRLQFGSMAEPLTKIIFVLTTVNILFTLDHRLLTVQYVAGMDTFLRSSAHCNGLKERFEKEGKAFYAVIGGDFNSDPTSDKWAEDDTLSMIQDAGFRWAGQGVDRKELISWLTDGRYPDAVFDHMMVMAPDGYEVAQSSTHKTDRSVSDHRAVIIELAGLPD